MSEPIHFLSLELDFGFNCLFGGYKFVLLTSRIFSKEKVITEGGKLPFLLLDSKRLGFFFHRSMFACLYSFSFNLLFSFFPKGYLPRGVTQKPPHSKWQKYFKNLHTTLAVIKKLVKIAGQGINPMLKMVICLVFKCDILGLIGISTKTRKEVGGQRQASQAKQPQIVSSWTTLRCVKSSWVEMLQTATHGYVST